MVLPFIAMAVGGLAAAAGAAMQAKATNDGIERANSIPLRVRGNLDKLVADSEAAGFNPLTVLRAGGLSNYTTTTGHNAHLFAQRQSVGGALLGGIGNTISNVGSAVLQNSQHMASLASSERIAAFSALPSFGAGGFGGSGGGAAYGAAGNLRIAGYPVSRNDGWSDAQEIEDRYGDAVSWIYGFGVAGADAFSTGVDYMNRPSTISSVHSGAISFARYLDQVRSKVVGRDGVEYRTGGSF